MIRGTRQHRSYVVVGALGASLMLGVLTGRLVGSDTPAVTVPPSPVRSGAPAGGTPVDRRPTDGDVVGRSSSPEPLPAAAATVHPSTPVATPAAPAAATQVVVYITRFDGSVVAVPAAPASD